MLSCPIIPSSLIAKHFPNTTHTKTRPTFAYIETSVCDSIKSVIVTGFVSKIGTLWKRPLNCVVEEISTNRKISHFQNHNSFYYYCFRSHKCDIKCEFVASHRCLLYGIMHAWVRGKRKKLFWKNNWIHDKNLNYFHCWINIKKLLLFFTKEVKTDNTIFWERSSFFLFFCCKNNTSYKKIIKWIYTNPSWRGNWLKNFWFININNKSWFIVFFCNHGERKTRNSNWV